MGNPLQLMAVMIQQPLLALIPGAAFVGLALWSGRRLVLAAALGWAGYAGYELLMKQRVLNPTHPYIAMHDLPKIEHLRKIFPARYRERPVTAERSN